MKSEKVKGEIRRTIESITRWKHWELIELSIQPDHIHMCIITTPRDSISYVMQIIKGKSSAWLKKKVKRQHGLYERGSLWARGYYASTIGIEEIIIRRYIKHQEKHHQTDQPSLFEKAI